MNARSRHLWPILLLLGIVLPLSGQEEEHVHFQLSSNRTYAPGERAKIDVWGHGVSALEFRLYRINDPIQFLRKLPDKHHFGGEARPLEREASWLEEFHEWKRLLRAEIRDFFRLQFSAESRMRIRGWMQKQEKTKEKAKQPPTTEFAQIPVLNPQQLIATWKESIPRGGYGYSYGSVSVNLPGKGLFVVEAVYKQKRAYTILNATEIGLISKVWPGHVLVFAQHRRTGAPLARQPVLMWVGQKEIAKLETNEQGLAEAVVQEARPEEVTLLASSPGDFALSGAAAWNLSSDPGRFFTGYIYTDRPVYRPGHTVNFKGILRQNPGAAYELPSAREVDVEIQDPENNPVYQRKLRVSANGTVHGQFELPESAPLGYYSLVIRAGAGEIAKQAQAGFHVEEYKKPEYEVRVRPEVNRVVQGTPIRATIEARYYFGEPVINAKVTWVVHTSTYWYPLYADEDEPDLRSEGEIADYDNVGEQLEEQSGTLDSEGRLTITIPTKVHESKLDLRYRIEARVTDAAGREISGRGNVLVTYGSFLVNAQPERYVYDAGRTARWMIEARDYDGNRVAVPAKVTLHRWVWQQGGKQTSPVLAAKSIQTQANAAVPVEFSVLEAGSYYARVVALTPEGREVEDSGWVWVTGRGFAWGQERREVQIVPDRKSYQPGDTARVLVLTGMTNATVLVTTEGSVLHTRRIVRAEDASFTVDVPILREYAPNFYVNVAFLHDNQMFEGSKRISVPPSEHQLQVELFPSKKEFKPGENATYILTAIDNLGRPVAGAEFSLGVVDEAIYAIRPEAARDILNFFYGSIYNRVGTSSSLSYYFTGESGKRAMELAGGGIAQRRALGQIKPERLVEPRIRKAFPDTAYWVADLTTDSSGRATARFAFPDALTTWRATSRGVTRDTKVGSAVERTIVRKNLLVRLAVPRFFTEGDEVTLSVLVHNYLASDKHARVSLAVEGVEILEGETRDVLVPNKGEAKLDWRVRVKPGREVKVLGKALTDEESDGMELTLPILPFGVKQVVSRAGFIADARADQEAEVVFPQHISPHSRVLEVSVAPSIAGALFGALEYLTAFPYGCTEQTMSSFLPNIVVARALKELNVQSNVNETALKKKIQEGFDRLRDFQHEDGGWGWWKSDESHTFMTAYVLAGLSQAERAGYKIPPDDLLRAQAWLRAAFDREKRALSDLRAYVAYALALSGERSSAVFDAVWERRSDMSPYGRALLGLALDEAGDKRAAEIAAQLEREAKTSEAEAWWESERDDLLGFYGDTSTEATAHALKLLVRHRPQSPLLPKAAVWLMRNRNSGYYWTSTKQTAMVIYGLIDYLKHSGELNSNFTVTVTVNSREVLARRFGAADALAPQAVTARLRAEDLPEGASKIRISKSGSGRLYWSARGEYFSTEEKLTRTGTVQLNLLREYFRLVPEKRGDQIVHRLDPFDGTAAQGDVLAVRLTVSGGEWRYLHLEDPIPAGTELIAREDLYQIWNRPSWWYFDFMRRELRDDRVVFFETYFHRGQQQYIYLLKVVTPGRFRVSPARIQPMYQPQFLSTADSRLVEVR
jgi:hypothetical protein